MDSNASTKISPEIPHGMAVQLRVTEMGYAHGLLGKFFGTKNAPTNIAGMAVCFTFLLMAMAFFLHGEQYGATWQLLVPIVTLTLGYLFGKITK